MKKSLTDTMFKINVSGTKLPYLKNCEIYYDFDSPLNLWLYTKFMQRALNKFYKEGCLCSFAEFMEMEYPSKKKKRQ